MDQSPKRSLLHCRRAGEWDPQITLDRGPQCTTACTRRERATELAQIGGRPARQTPPHQGRDPVKDALWEWKPVQHIRHILRYVVKLLEPINKSRRSPVDPPQLLHPNPQKTREDGTAIIVKAAEHKSMNKGDSSIKSQKASNDPQLPQLTVAATTHLICNYVD